MTHLRLKPNSGFLAVLTAIAAIGCGGNDERGSGPVGGEWQTDLTLDVSTYSECNVHRSSFRSDGAAKGTFRDGETSVDAVDVQPSSEFVWREVHLYLKSLPKSIFTDQTVTLTSDVAEGSSFTFREMYSAGGTWVSNSGAVKITQDSLNVVTLTFTGVEMQPDSRVPRNPATGKFKLNGVFKVDLW